MYTKILFVLLAIINVVACNNSSRFPTLEKQDELAPFSGKVVFVKEYVDSIEKMIFYNSIEATVNNCGYQFKYISDSIYDTRLNKMINRFNTLNDDISKTNCKKNSLFTIFTLETEQVETLQLLDSANFVVDNRNILIRKFISHESNDQPIQSSYFYSDQLGRIEAIYRFSSQKDLRIRLESTTLLTKEALKNLQMQLRSHKMYTD